MPLNLLNHSALALFAQSTRIPTSARSIGFCAIWVCISSSSSISKLIYCSVQYEIIKKFKALWYDVPLRDFNLRM